ncbi:MAG: TIGR02147 family protein [Oligoflexia bacterium]|nr:TIGR02147 family protein [Oligoflexia bacterium]
MLWETRDYRELLKKELAERCKANSLYSVRAFARDLKFSPGHLSEILAGKKGLSRRAAQSVARHLGYSGEEVEFFCDLVDSLHARGALSRQVSAARVLDRSERGNCKRLQLDAFQAISNWYHFAILQLAHLKGFRGEVDWIARKLDLPRSKTLKALRRLERLELLERRGARYHVLNHRVASPDGVSSEAIRTFHKQVLAKAILAIDRQDLKERDYTTLLLPMSSERVEIARGRIREFRNGFCQELSGGEQLDEVYSLSIQLFRVTRKGGDA